MKTPNEQLAAFGFWGMDKSSLTIKDLPTYDQWTQYLIRTDVCPSFRHAIVELSHESIQEMPDHFGGKDVLQILLDHPDMPKDALPVSLFPSLNFRVKVMFESKEWDVNPEGCVPPDIYLTWQREVIDGVETHRGLATGAKPEFLVHKPSLCPQCKGTTSWSDNFMPKLDGIQPLHLKAPIGFWHEFSQMETGPSLSSGEPVVNKLIAMLVERFPWLGRFGDDVVLTVAMDTAVTVQDLFINHEERMKSLGGKVNLAYHGFIKHPKDKEFYVDAKWMIEDGERLRTLIHEEGKPTPTAPIGFVKQD